MKHSVTGPRKIQVVVVKKLQGSNFYTSFSYWL